LVNNPYLAQSGRVDSLLFSWKTRFLWTCFLYIIYHHCSPTSFTNFFYIGFILKDFAFVNRLFVIQLGNELGPRWTISDKKGHVHHVTFNMNTYGPRITDGWVDIRKFYQVQPPKLCYLRHTGNSTFEIHFYDHCSESTVHKFLSHVRTNAPLIRSKLIHFEFRLSKYNCKASFLVTFFIFFFDHWIQSVHKTSFILFNLDTYKIIYFWYYFLYFLFSGFKFRLTSIFCQHSVLTHCALRSKGTSWMQVVD